MNSPALLKCVPLCFVLLWSTGFIGAKYTLPYAEPFTLLAIRMSSAVLLLGILSRSLKVSFPSCRGALHSMSAGAMIHVIYLGSVFVAISMGMSAGLSALIVGLQPLLTALIGWSVYQDKFTGRQIVGLILGLLGVALVVSMRERSITSVLPSWAYVFATAGLIGITIGTIYQKRCCAGIDLLAGMFYQYLSAAILFLCFSAVFEEQSISYTPQLLGGLLWMIFPLSLLSVWLLMILIKNGQSTKVASYFYLVPAVTAILAWQLFGEMLTPVAVLGMILAAAGVYLVVRTVTR